MHCLALEEFAAEGEVFELPETSWNQRDEVLLAAGAKVTAASADFSPFFAGTLDFHMNLKTLRFLFFVCGSVGTPFEIHEFITETFVDEVIAFGGTIHMEY